MDGHDIEFILYVYYLTAYAKKNGQKWNAQTITRDRQDEQCNNITVI